MQSNPDFADEYFCLPPLDILVTVHADEAIRRLAEQLEGGCHHVTLVEHLPNAFAEADALAPDVLIVEASSAEGVALARRIRARFGERIVLVGLEGSRTPPAFARLFDYLLPKPVEFTAFGRALGLIPDEDRALTAAAVASGGQFFMPQGWRDAA